MNCQQGWRVSTSNSGSGVQSVNGLNTDNSDPLNPIVKISVDGITIIGDGTPANPLIAVQFKNIIGSFFDTTTQIASINTPTPMEYNTTDTANTNGVSITNDGLGNPTEINVAKKGTYNIQFSAQLYRSAGGTTEQFYVWLRKNGLDIPNSATQLTFKDNSKYEVASWNFFVDFNVTDKVQLIWFTTDSNIKIVSKTASSPIPEIPSVIMTISRQD